MKIPFFKRPGSKSKKYLVLFLKETEGAGFVIDERAGKYFIVEKEKFTYSNGWDNLVEDVDEMIFRLENKLKIQLDETMFLIYSHLIDEKTKEIKKIYLGRIKEIVKNLELKALGYVECFEAVANFLERKEELPLTAILVELDKSNLGVFIYKGGRVSYSKILPRSGNLSEDLMVSFNELKGKFLLPSRIILYNSKDLDDESTRILSYKWSDDLFIQLPRVEIIKEEEVFEGLVRVFEEQLNKREVNIQPSKDFAQKEVLGFIVGGDVTERTSHLPPPKENPLPPEKKFNPPSQNNFLTKIKGSFGKIRLPMNFFSKRLSILIGVVIIVLAIFLNEYFFHKSKLTIFVPAKAIDKSLEVKGYLGSITEEDGLPISIATFSADFSESKATTGKREIGEKARGEVTVHNFDDREKTFSKGASLEANGLSFILDDEVKVASSSLTSDGSAKLPGKSKVKITASVIGPESNLGKSTRFKVEDLSTSLCFAINDNALAGGTKKEVRTVAKKDIDDLKSIVLDKSKKQNQTAKKLPPGNKFIEDLTETKLADLKFSKELGEEADSVKLQTSAKTTAYYYSEKKLTEDIVNLLKKNLQSGFKIEKEKLTYKITDVEENDEEIILSLDVKAKEVRDIVYEDALKKIFGKSENDLKKILKDSYGVDGYELSIQQPLPIFKDKLPLFEKNIDFKISSL